ncbi:SERTA domain-containing protein 1 [Elgaria multicarinata webbii]|uniref:SERTA domain-containing protein 1 n=1 Tax=Elgaria multicarinata webbii TaxID=159646 RepID=UPI002FCD262D
MLAKGVKRKRSEDQEEPQPPAATPAGSLFSLSVSKLHQSLQHVEPDLRHLVLVANTLRRMQGEMQPGAAPIPQPALAPGSLATGSGSSSSSSSGGSSASRHQDTCRRPQGPPLSAPLEQLLLSSVDVSVLTTILEDLSGLEGFGDSVHPSASQPEGGQLSVLSPEPERTCPPSPLEILGPGGYLLEDGVEGTFEDIDTSMYDCDLWSPAALPNFKEAFSSPEEEQQQQPPDLADLDYLMDMLVEAQAL